MISDATKQQFDDLVKKNKVVLFMKGNKHFPQCGFSSRVVGMLKELGTPFETVNVLSSNEIRDGIKEYSSWPTIPQLYVNGEFVGGCDIVTEMFQSGDLHKVIGVEEKKVEAPKVTIEPNAAKAILAADEGDGTMLRVEVSAQFQYELYFDQKKAGDFEIESNGVKILFDKASAGRSNGLTVTWVDAGGGAFKIENPSEPPHVKPISVKELKSWLDSGKKFDLLDVRPDDERARAKIEQAKKFDESMFASIPKDTTIVFQCHHGGRSRSASERAIKEGFTNVYNLEGGIEAWSTEIDPKVSHY